MISINNVSFSIDDNDILKNINLNINKGKIIGIIGPNGVGKTTFLRCLSGIYKPTSGSIAYDDMDVFDNAEVKSKIGYVADENIIQTNLKVCQVVKFYEYSYSKFDKSRYDELNEIFNIPKDKFVFQLSKGMKMRLSLMLAFSIHAEFLILDEPTSGLDAILKKKLLKIFTDEVCENNATIVISSHHLDELERICDEVAILDKGELTYQNSIESMKTKIKKVQVAFNEDIHENKLKMSGVIKITKVGRIFTIITEEYDDKFLDKINKLNPLFIEEVDLSLEDIFVGKVDKEAL